MTESLLSFSEVLLFGRVLEDLKVGQQKPSADHTVRVATRKVVKDFNDVGAKIDRVTLAVGNKVLVRKNGVDKNGVYKVKDVGGGVMGLETRTKIPNGQTVGVSEGKKYSDSIAVQKLFADQQLYRWIYRPRMGNNHLKDQFGDEAAFARIYGFSYEGTYYELPEPSVFLVRGDGDDAFANSGAMARSPLSPSESGVASADYQVSDGVKVWAYDKADYTMRLDVMTGMFEQVLLDIYFGFDSPGISGAKVSGAKVSGAKVSGAKVSGAKVSGAKVSGAKARGSGD